MADPPVSSEAPPVEPGPAIGTDAWHQAQLVRRKMREHGAAISIETGEKIRNFTIEYSFNEAITEDTPTINLYNLHRAFIVELLSVTEGDAHLLTTHKPTNPDTPIAPPILSIASFPENDVLHRKFFARQIIRTEATNRTKILIHHSILMKETVASAKRKVFNHLKLNKLWMVGGELASVETVGIGWFLGAHATMIYRPQIERLLNYRVAMIPKDVVFKLIGIHGGATEDLEDLPYLYINTRPQNFGVTPNRVSSNAITVSCVKTKARLMKELISLVPIHELPYRYIPAGLVNILSVDDYRKFLILNNDRQNDLQGITIQGFSKQLFAQSGFLTEQPATTVEQFFLAETSIESVQETNMTPSHGRFIVVVHKPNFQMARKFIEDFCTKTFSLIVPEGTNQDDYRVSVGSLPHLTDTASAGGAVASLGALLGTLLRTEEASRGTTFATKAGTWAQKTSPRLIFDKDAEFPPLPSNAKPSNNNTTTNNLPSQPAPGSDSIASDNTTSTFAPTQGQSGQTIVSQDVSTVVSEMRSLMTEQSQKFEKILEHQEKIAKETAKESREFMERMMDKMLEMNRFDRISTETYKQRRARLGVRASPNYEPPRQKNRTQSKRTELDEATPKADQGSDNEDSDAHEEEEDDDDLYDTEKYNDEDDDVSFSNPNDDMEDDEDASVSKMSHSTSPEPDPAAIPTQIHISEKKGSRKRSHVSIPKSSTTKPKSSTQKKTAASTSSSIQTSMAHNKSTSKSLSSLKNYGSTTSLRVSEWVSAKHKASRLSKTLRSSSSIDNQSPNAQKMTRTGTAPPPLSIEEKFSRQISLEHHRSDSTPAKPAPDPEPDNPSKLE